MSNSFIVSSRKDKFQYTIKEKIKEDDFNVFSSNEDFNEFKSIINDIFSDELHYQAYFEIIASEKLKKEQINIISKKISDINIENIKLSFISEFIRNTVTVICFMARRIAPANCFFEIRVASAGNVDAGKSTLLGVLTKNILDDGRGFARSKMFRYRHEIESGRTSSVGESFLPVDSSGKIIYDHRIAANKPEADGVSHNAYKIIDFLDLAGHEKYLKTTIFGLVGLRPDYIMLVIGANMGLVGMCREHLGLSLALDIPIFFVLTKIDMCPANVMSDTSKKLITIIKSHHVNKKHINIKTEEDVVTAYINLVSNQLCPIFHVSCVTGQGLDHLRLFLSMLPPRQVYEKTGSILFWIDDTFDVTGVGCVVSGMLVRGIINLSSNLVIGPTPDGEFIQLKIKSIFRKRSPVHELCAGQTGSFAIKKIKRNDVRKGMVIVSPAEKPAAYWQFKAHIHILHHPTTIVLKYQAMVHTGPVRQTCSIIWMEKEHLRTGDKADVIMQFIRRPEYLVVNSVVVFREGRTKAIGVVKELLLPSNGPLKICNNPKPPRTPKRLL